MAADLEPSATHTPGSAPGTFLVKEPGDFLDHDPGEFLVFDLPTRGSPALLPILALVTAEGFVEVPAELVRWSRNLSRTYDTTVVSDRLRVIGRLHEFGVRHFGGLTPSADPRCLIWNYYAFALGYDSYRDIPQRSNMASMIRTRRDQLAIGSYLRFCADPVIDGSFFLGRIDANGPLEEDMKVAPTSGDAFFDHLRPQRERWLELSGRSRSSGPGVRIKQAVTSGSSSASVMSVAEVKAVISNEPNFMFRALWLLLAGVGIRISEALNAWRTDVLPGSLVNYFEQIPHMDRPLVLLCHPTESTYVGDLAAGRNNRNQHLKTRYNLTPRNMLTRSDRFRAGWKNPTLSNNRLKTGMGHWLHDELARDFALSATEVRAFHLAIGDNNPYFFVNTKNEEHYGQPMTYASAAKALDRAFIRVGLQPHVHGRTLHGFRHFYKWFAKTQLKLPPEIVQGMMHHKSIHSQEDYGRKSADVNEALTEIGMKRAW